MLQSLRSPDNTIRKQAELDLQTQAQSNPIELLNFLVNQMTDPQEAEFASLILSKTFFENEANLALLSTPQIQQVITFVTQALLVDNKLSYLKRMCDLAVKGLLKLDKYDEMTVLLFAIAEKATTQNMKLSTMYYIEIMCEFAYCDEQLAKNAEKLNQIFQHFFQDTDPQIRCATLKSMTTFLVAIEDESLLNKFQPLIPTVMQQCLAAIQVDQATSVVALQSLTDLLENHPKFLKNVQGDLLSLYTQVFTLENQDLRKAALHGLQALSSCAPAFIRKSDTFKSQTVGGIMKMLSEVERKDWESTFDDNCLQLDDISSVAEDCLGKMVKDLTIKYLLPLFVPLIMNSLKSTNINEQHAGLIAMATLSDTAAEHFKSELPHIMNMILPLAASQSKLIVYDLLTCIAALCQEFTPIIQNQFGSQILQLIVTCMQQSISQKIQYIAIACLVDFTRELVEDKEAAKSVLAPVSTYLIEQLYKVIEQNLCEKPNTQQLHLAEQSLAAFSALATSLKEQFTQYYDAMMPFMIKNMMIDNSQIRSLLVECMGCFLVSISESRNTQCRQDANQIILSFLAQQSKMELDDPQHTSIFFFYTQIATALKSEFGCYLEQVFPLVERALRIDVGFQVNGNNEGKNVTSVKLELKFLGVKDISLNTSALEQKIEGAHTLINLAEHCGKAFYPYIPRTLQLVKEFINYKHSSDIQKSMSKCVQYLMLSCTSTTDMIEVFNQICPTLVGELNLFVTHKHFDRAAIIAEDIANCMNLIKSPLQQIEYLFNITLKAMQTIQKQKEATQFEDEEQFEQDCEDIDELMSHITNIATELMSVHKCEAIQQLMQIYYSFLNTKSTKNQVINAIAFFNVTLPICSENVFQQAQNEIMKCYANYSKTADLEMTQNLLYGYGNFVKRIPNLDTQNILQLANQIVSAPDAKCLDKVGSYETAMTTIGKVGMNCNIPQKEELVQQFLSSLPHEYQDCQETHLMLLQEAQSQNPTLLSMKPKLLECLTRIQNQDASNPENELLCDQGRILIQQLLS